MTPKLNHHQKPQKRQWDRPIYLPKFIYVLMHDESKEALKKYSLEALLKLLNRRVQEVLCCLDDPLLLQVQNQKINPLR